MKPAANYGRLIRVFEDRRFAPRGDLHRAIEGLPPAEAMPSPWAAWTVIYLICCRRKQLRAAEVVASLLGPEWEWRCGRADVDEGACRAFYHSQSEWELRSLGVTCSSPTPRPRT